MYIHIHIANLRQESQTLRLGQLLRHTVSLIYYGDLEEFQESQTLRFSWSIPALQCTTVAVCI